MALYILRLDDACPQMDTAKWERVETLLDKYGIEPIVGVIPDNRDPDFAYGEDGKFWERCKNWQGKRWTIAIHGLHHFLTPHTSGGYFQKSHSVKTEWAGVAAEKQSEMLKEGFRILRSHNLTPTCFFAPCHTYDMNTVDAIHAFNEKQGSLYISDGYALHPYYKRGVWFLPSLFDAPHAFGGQGYYTFVLHPNNMNENAFNSLEAFLSKYGKRFINADDVMRNYIEGAEKSQGALGSMLENGIYIVRGLKKILRGFRHE